MDALNYEHFVRAAFGYPGAVLDRWGDPAGLANADLINGQHLDKVKVATAYSMQIFITDILEKKAEQLADSEHERIESFFLDVTQANDIETIDKLITEFKNTVIDCYYERNDGQLRLR